MTCIYPDVAAVLLRAGADPDLRNAKGQTALEAIEARNYGDGVAAFLRQWIAEHPKRESRAP
jgi:ankyrin repeat protein